MQRLQYTNCVSILTRMRLGLTLDVTIYFENIFHVNKSRYRGMLNENVCNEIRSSEDLPLMDALKQISVTIKLQPH